MSYQTTRQQEQLNQADHAIRAFIDRYNQMPNPPAYRQTVFLFPGGMASQLMRARTRYQDGVTGTQTFTYDPVWLTPFSFVGDALLLKLRRQAPGDYRDVDNRVIVPDGAINLLGCSIYDGFTAWCDAKKLDWFVFGWDWRRRLGETNRFFTRKFLPYFRARVMAGCNNADPLQHFSLVGHSMGGMIANGILRTNHPNLANLDKVVTAGTPFYGYAQQLHRWFEGDQAFNGPFGVFKTAIIEVISSLPGCYALMFLDELTFANNKAALAADPDYPLTAYPSVDALYPATPADPYNPQTNGVQKRYPAKSLTGFDPDELAHGKRVVRRLAAPLPANLVPKLYCIRGVKRGKSTVGSATWAWTPPVFAPPPITDGPGVEGDGVQPAWSTRLVTQPAAHWIKVTSGTVDHMFMMNHPRTLAAIGGVLGV